MIIAVMDIKICTLFYFKKDNEEVINQINISISLVNKFKLVASRIFSIYILLTKTHSNEDICYNIKIL